MNLKAAQEIMATLWQGRPDVFGYYKADTDESGTAHKPVTAGHWWRHLQPDTKWTLGRHPLLVDGSVWWGCLDLDRIGLTDDEASAIVRKVRGAGLPLFGSLSKSRGLHLWWFFTEPQRAESVRRVLYRWAVTVLEWRPLRTGESKGSTENAFEIFPKADMVTPKAPCAGGWTNICWSGGHASSRYGIGPKGPARMDDWLTTAYQRRTPGREFGRLASGVPPIPPGVLIESSSSGESRGATTGLMLNIGAGSRNETVFRALCAAHRWGWQIESLEALCRAQWPDIPQEGGPKGYYSREEMLDTLFKRVASGRYEPQADLLELNGTPEMYRKAIGDLQRVGWSDTAIRACAHTEDLNT